MKRFGLFFLSFFIFVCFPLVSFSGNVDTFGIGAKAIALGGAYAAYADEPFAAYYNPAGLTQIKRPMVSVGAEVIDPDLKLPDFRAKDWAGREVQPYNKTVTDISPTLVVPHFGVAMPLPSNDRFVFAVAAYVPYGLHIKWSDDPSKDPGAYNAFESYYVREVVNPTISYKINDKLSVGFGICIGRSKSGSQRRLYAPSMPSLNNRIIKGDFTDDANYSYIVGLMYKPLKRLALGLTYRSRTSTSFDGYVELEGVQRVGASTSIDHPDQVQFGVRYMIFDNVSVEGDVEWTHWSLIDKYVINFDEPFMGKKEEVFNRNWHNTTQIRLGVEWKASKLLALRAGYYHDPSPIPEGTFDMLWPDGDKDTYSAGAGLNFGHVSLDLALQYTTSEYNRCIGDSKELNNSYSNPVTGQPGDVYTKAKGKLWGYAATLNYTF